MVESADYGAMIGAPVLGPEDQRIGTVGQVFVNPDDGRPNWITVRTGWIGKSESFVPLDTADWDEERVHVKYDKEFIKGAPRVDTDGALTESEERELYRHYGIGVDDDHPAGQSDDPTGGSPSAYMDTPGGSHSDRPTGSDYGHTGTGRHSAERTEDDSGNTTDAPPKPGMRRMRRFVVTEIEVDEAIPEDELAAAEQTEAAESKSGEESGS